MYLQLWFSAFFSIFLAFLFIQLKPCNSVCFCKLNPLDLFVDRTDEIPGLKEQNYFKHFFSDWWSPFHKNIYKYLHISLLSKIQEVCLWGFYDLMKATFIGTFEARCFSCNTNLSQQLPYAGFASFRRQSKQVGTSRSVLPCAKEKQIQHWRQRRRCQPHLLSDWFTLKLFHLLARMIGLLSCTSNRNAFA